MPITFLRPLHQKFLPRRTEISTGNYYNLKNKTRTAVHHPGFATPKTYLPTCISQTPAG